MSFNQIFKKTYTIPQMGTINCHAGKLPFYGEEYLKLGPY